MAKGKVLRIRKVVPESWEEALQQFCYWKQAQGLSERTIIDYRTQVSVLFRRYPEAYNAESRRI